MAKRPANLPNLVQAVVAREITSGNVGKLTEATNTRFPPGIVDRLAGALSPKWRTSRDLGRMQRMIMSGGYEITKSSRMRRSHSQAAAGGSDQSLDSATLWGLREICRDHDRNSALLHGIIDRMADNVAGPEYRFRPNSGDDKFDADATDALREASAAAEYRGLFDLQGMIYTGFRSINTDGDFLLLHLKEGRLQAVEAHDLVTPRGGKGWKDRAVVNGVELDEVGRHTAYYVRPAAAPTKTRIINSAWIDGWKNAQRVPSADSRLVANRNRFSQTRGVPNLASSLGLFDRLDGYLDSETLAAELASHLTWFIKRGAAEALPGTDEVTDPNASSDSVETFQKLLRSEPGMIFDLAADEELKVVDPHRPGETFEPYMISVLRMVGAGVGLPLELVLLDFSKTNYSSARAALLQAYRTFRRWQVFVQTQIIQPIYNRWMSRWIAAGDLALLKTAYRLEYFPPRWAWIDPLKMVVAQDKKVASGAGTLEQWIAEEGRTLDEVAATRKKELAILRANRIPTTTAPDNLSQGETIDAN